MKKKSQFCGKSEVLQGNNKNVWEKLKFKSCNIWGFSSLKNNLIA